MDTELILTFILAVTVFNALSFLYKFDKAKKHNRNHEIERRKRKARKLLGIHDSDESSHKDDIFHDSGGF